VDIVKTIVDEWGFFGLVFVVKLKSTSQDFWVCSSCSNRLEKCQRKALQGRRTFVMGKHVTMANKKQHKDSQLASKEGKHLTGGDVHLHLRDPAALVVGHVVGELQHLALQMRAEGDHKDRSSHP
jgi:hypothetical protein